MRDYRERDVDGLLSIWKEHEPPRIYPTPVTVRTMADGKGQTLSLTVSDMQISIPLEQVKDIIAIVKN